MMSMRTFRFHCLSGHQCHKHRERGRHLERIKTLTLQEAKGFGTKDSQLSSMVSTSSTDEAFTICAEYFCVDGCQLSADILHNMFCNAVRLVLALISTCPLPGSATAKLIESKSEQSHILLLRKQITDTVMNGCAKICSHIIACAYQDE